VSNERRKRYDVFLSYGHGDAPWVEILAGNLHRCGLDVFLDRWEIVPGSELASSLQEGLAEAETVMLVVSDCSLGRPWVEAELNAALTAAIEKRQRFIPVIRSDVSLPPFVGSRVYVDFRQTDGDADGYLVKVRELVRAVQGRAVASPPERDGRLVVPEAQSSMHRPSIAATEPAGPLPSADARRQLVDLLERSEPLRDPYSLRLVLDLAEARIGRLLQYRQHPALRLQLFELVRVMESDPVALDGFVSALDEVAPNSPQIADVRRAAGLLRESP
jgi:hypothetical protein